MDPLIKAVLVNDLASVKSFLKMGINIEIKDEERRTPFLNAVINNNMPIVKYLLDNGANIQIQDNLGYSALHYASQNYSIEMTKLLLENGSLIDAVDAHGNTPLGRAVFSSRGRGEVIQLLISAGADKMKKKQSRGVPDGFSKFYCKL
jgi:uncharacterized protein